MIKTARLTLRAAHPEDLADMHAFYRDPRAMQFWSTPPHPGPSTTKSNLTRQIRAAADKLTYFVIEMDGRVIGNAGMHRENEVGFILHPDFWRQGIVKEAMQAIIPYLFEQTDHDHLTAEADPRNQASISALTSLGFVETHREERTFFIEGEWSDSVYFALPRPDPAG